MLICVIALIALVGYLNKEAIISSSLIWCHSHVWFLCPDWTIVGHHNLFNITSILFGIGFILGGTSWSWLLSLLWCRGSCSSYWAWTLVSHSIGRPAVPACIIPRVLLCSRQDSQRGRCLVFIIDWFIDRLLIIHSALFSSPLPSGLLVSARRAEDYYQHT